MSQLRKYSYPVRKNSVQSWFSLVFSGQVSELLILVLDLELDNKILIF